MSYCNQLLCTLHFFFLLYCLKPNKPISLAMKHQMCSWFLKLHHYKKITHHQQPQIKAHSELKGPSSPPVLANSKLPWKMWRVTPIERQKGTREKSRTLRTRIWAIRWQWCFIQIKVYMDTHPNVICNVEFFIQHWPTGARPPQLWQFPLGINKMLKKGQKTMKSKPTTGLGNCRYLMLARVFRESISLVTLSLQSPPGFQIQDLQSQYSHPHLLHPLGFGELFHFWGPQMSSAILCCIVSPSNISLSILSPGTCTSKPRNEFVPVKYIWQRFTLHCLVAGHTLCTGKCSSCFPMALLQAQMQHGWCQGSAGLGLLCVALQLSISFSSRRGEQTPPTVLKLGNSSPRFYFKAEAKRTGSFSWCYQSVSKTADSREKCKQDF